MLRNTGGSSSVVLLLTFPAFFFFLHVLCSLPYISKKGQIEESKEILLLRLTHLLFFCWMMRVCNANVQMAVSPIVVEVLHFKCTIYFLCCEKSAPRVHGSNVFCLYSPLCWAFFFFILKSFAILAHLLLGRIGFFFLFQ